ncbi:MAG: shikimate dehydrogenase [candidate division WOR-3 bacterium]
MFITGVIGFPLKLTYSPLLHNTAFKKLRIPGVYYPLCVPPENFKEIIFKLKELGFSGVNITNPYKIEILKYLDGVNPTVMDIGAVNTVFIENNKMVGENTDTYGFRESLKAYDIDLKNKIVLIIGAGGVARAILYVLCKERTQRIFITNRTISKAYPLIENYDIEGIELKRVPRILKDVDFVINATSIDIHKRIIPFLKNGSIYYDTNYRFKISERKGIKVINGIEMLVLQGAYSFSLWTKQAPPVSIMRDALKEVL